MIQFNLFILVIATVFFINDVVIAHPGANFHDWKVKSCDSRKITRMGFELVEYYNYYHHDQYYLKQILKAKSKNNGTKYYDVYFLAVKDCNDRKQKPKIEIEEDNSKAE
uniref:Cystatin domain-containing protein n=1 Tax=Strongyloides stercoralis TaxID=6248 RepID=A0A0K0EEX8_STRER